MTTETTKTRRARSPMKTPSKAQYKTALEHYVTELNKLIEADDDVRVSQLKAVVANQPDLTPVAQTAGPGVEDGPTADGFPGTDESAAE